MLWNNIAVVLTHVSSRLYLNLDIIPNMLRRAPLFLLDNPIALQKRFLMLRNNPSVKKIGAGSVEVEEQNAMEMGVELFDWLDGLNTEGVSPYDKQPAVDKAKRLTAFSLLAGSTRILSSLGSLGIGRDSDPRA